MVPGWRERLASLFRSDHKRRNSARRIRRGVLVGKNISAFLRDKDLENLLEKVEVVD
jgi:hypothetical protein